MAKELTCVAHQPVLLPAEDHLMVEVLVAEMLRNGEAAQAVARVVEVPGSERSSTA